MAGSLCWLRELSVSTLMSLRGHRYEGRTKPRTPTTRTKTTSIYIRGSVASGTLPCNIEQSANLPVLHDSPNYMLAAVGAKM